MTEEIEFNDEQLQIIKFIAGSWKNSLVAFWTNLFEVLRLGADIDRCKQSPRFQYQDKEGNTYSRETILACLINNGRVTTFKSYLTKEYKHIIDVFKDHELIKRLTKFERNYLFQTTNGYLYIANTNVRNAEIDSYGNVIQLNMKDGIISNETPIIIQNPPITENDKKKGVISIVDKRNRGDLHRMFQESSYRRVETDPWNETIIFYNKCKRCSYDITHEEVLYDESAKQGKIIIRTNPPSCSKCGNIKKISPSIKSYEIDNKEIRKRFNVDLARIVSHDHEFNFHKLISYMNKDPMKNKLVCYINETLCVVLSGDLEVEYEIECQTCGRRETRNEIVNETNNPFNVLKEIREFHSKANEEIIQHAEGICPRSSKSFNVHVENKRNYERDNDWEIFYWNHHFHYCSECKFIFKDEYEFIQDYCMKPSKRTQYVKINHNGDMKLE